MDPIIRKSELAILLGVTAATGIFGNYFPSSLYLDFSLIFALHVGWHSSPFKGAASGTAFGLVQDYYVSGFYLGLNGLSKTIVGFSGSYLRRWVTLEGLLARLVLIISLSLLDSTVVYGMLGILGQFPGGLFWGDVLIKSIMTGIAGTIVFWVYSRVKFPRKDFRHIGGA